ncbi:MAG TPA: acetylglutamate kinase [Chloroflexia bacterium]|nr:acetylglutamate kinase [Chloroflexia bacterium]
MRAAQQARTGDLAALAGVRIVVKLGGEIMLNARGLDAIAAQVATVSENGVRVVLVHGGGPQADALAGRLGHSVRKVAGRRVTDDDALSVAKMVYGGSINLELVAALKRHGARGVGLSGADADLVTVTRRPPVSVRDPKTGAEEWVDFGHVGDISRVDPKLLDVLWAAGCVPVVACIAADREGNLYNVNADTIAQVLAVAVGAARLVLLTNVPGILLDVADPGSPVASLDGAELASLVARGVIGGGMLPKAQNCLAALEQGVPAVQILDGTLDYPPLIESLTGGGAGTIVTNSKSEQ